MGCPFDARNSPERESFGTCGGRVGWVDVVGSKEFEEEVREMWRMLRMVTRVGAGCAS
ncbi:hypothetical protein STRIP9103_06206 [Streptomyces ipomoeae 91-03]|uniref:Uncharacterized protein n=1 Tax=Streptomyces ipomoeae 91-03 TaxID=698759 RepID=L1L6N2_9ACTN|nr:hypothetical protein STRIP9103_06206 [Streptomyces ipomoeae 91-03]